MSWQNSFRVWSWWYTVSVFSFSSVSIKNSSSTFSCWFNCSCRYWRLLRVDTNWFETVFISDLLSIVMHLSSQLNYDSFIDTIVYSLKLFKELLLRLLVVSSSIRAILVVCLGRYSVTLLKSSMKNGLFIIYTGLDFF